MFHAAPNFIGGKGEYGRNKQRQRLKNAVNDSLCGAACGAVGLFDIKSVLYNIEVEIRHINNAEIMNGVINVVIFIIFITVGDILYKPVKLHDCPFVDAFELFVGHHILVGVKIADTTENKSCGVADFAVTLGQLLKNFGGNSYVGMVVGGSDPQAENFGAVFFDNVVGIDAVSEGF